MYCWVSGMSTDNRFRDLNSVYYGTYKVTTYFSGGNNYGYGED